LVFAVMLSVKWGADALGAVLALVYLASGRRLAPVVLAHGVINTIILTALYVDGGVVG